MKHFWRLGQRTQFWIGFIVGLQLLASAITVVIVFAEEGGRDVMQRALHWVGAFEWLYNYQQLITGVAAVGAAFLSIRYIRMQIAQATRLEADRRNGKKEAARILLQLSLSELCGYAMRCGDLIRTLRSDPASGRVIGSKLVGSMPTLPSSVMDVMRELVENSKANERRYYVQLVLRLQVQNVRLSAMIDDMRAGRRPAFMEVNTYALDAAEVYAYAVKLFRYARGITNQVPQEITIEDMSSAIHNVGFWGERGDILTERARSHFQRGHYSLDRDQDESQ